MSDTERLADVLRKKMPNVDGYHSTLDWQNAARALIAAGVTVGPPRADALNVDVLERALVDLLNDYLATNGPDGYPQPMPESWRVVRDWLAEAKR